MARAQQTYYCSCGAKLHGNGAKASHRKGHERKGELHHQGGTVRALTRDQWEPLFANARVSFPTSRLTESEIENGWSMCADSTCRPAGHGAGVPHAHKETK